MPSKLSLQLTQAAPTGRLKSSTSDKELVFSAPERDYFVEFRGYDVRAIRRVYAYSPHSPGLAELFARIASRNGPFAGTESWESLEGEFSLSIACSQPGVVTLLISMRSRPEAPDEWRISETLTVDLGQLSAFATRAKQFFDAVAGA